MAMRAFACKFAINMGICHTHYCQETMNMFQEICIRKLLVLISIHIYYQMFRFWKTTLCLQLVMCWVARMIVIIMKHWYNSKNVMCILSLMMGTHSPPDLIWPPTPLTLATISLFAPAPIIINNTTNTFLLIINNNLLSACNTLFLLKMTMLDPPLG